MAEQILFESIWKVTQGGDTLLDFGDYVQEMLRLEPARNIQVAEFPDAVGIRTFDRKNRKHQLTFTRWLVFDTAVAAAVEQLHRTKNMIGGGADLQIRVSGYDGYLTLEKASVMSWPSAIHHRCLRMEYVILGGRLLGQLSVNEDRVVGDEAGIAVGDEAGEAVSEETD